MKVSDMYVTCPAVPTQLEGTLEDGRHFYFRERHGEWSFGMGDSPYAAVENSFDSGYGGECDEFMTIGEAQRRIRELASSLPLRGSHGAND